MGTHGEMVDCNGYPTFTGNLSINWWWLSDYNIASCSPTTGVVSTDVQGLSVGQTYINGTWTTYAWDPGPEDCYRSTWDSSDSQPVDVKSPPDHVRVINDQQGTICQGGLQLRQIQVQVVDLNNHDVTGFLIVGESVQNQSTNTCGNGNAQPTPCLPADPGGQFTDSMAVSNNLCNSSINRNSGCGYTLTSTWSWCTLDKPIWQYEGETRSNIVKVNGGLQFAPGTYLYAPGVPTP